ncbi:TetR family transcriptional regulator [Stenoxybacter acetivorans]|uniref:TetR family transcriptional regulator n=1 Tax=Stenoxybacter acetivorans TaxID=422441 RepID=UPI0006925DED|nr:TetR family transcriptional regulator [Stenoxybacter acetivorans]
MRKTKAEALQTRESLLDAALEVFYQRGVARASLQEIAKTAGMTRGAVYWHFKNKEDIFDALFQRQFSGTREKQLNEDIITGTTDALTTLQQTTAQKFKQMAHDRAYYQFFHVIQLNCEYTDDNQTISRLLQKYRREWHDHLQTVFQLCLQQKSLPQNTDITLAALYFQSLMLGLTDVWLSNPQQFDLDDAAERLIAVAIDTLRSSPHFAKKPPAEQQNDSPLTA